jgi:ribosomal protein S6--L-glutamate ligase
MAEIAAERGHAATVFLLDDITVQPGGSGAEAMIADSPLAEFDVVICRCDLSTPPWTEKVQQLLVLNGEPDVLVLDPVGAHIGAASKRSMLQQLTLNGVRVPPTWECHSVDQVRAAFERWGKIVVKPALGFRGLDVERLVEGPTASALELVSSVLERNGTLLAQPYLRHAGDYRMLVVGQQLSLCTRFDTHGESWKPFAGDDLTAPPVSFDYIEPWDEIADVALGAVAAMGLTTAGVDVIEDDGGLTVIEVNPVPGWAAWPPELATRPNTQLVEFVEAQMALRRRTGGSSRQRTDVGQGATSPLRSGEKQG